MVARGWRRRVAPEKVERELNTDKGSGEWSGLYGETELQLLYWTVMEAKVTRVHPASDPGRTYFLQISWLKDLGAGFDVVLSDGQAVWNGKVSEEEISKEAADMEMEREEYVAELRKVLLFEGRHADTYAFHISKEDINEGYLQFSYEKKLKDISFRLGSLMLQLILSPGDVISKLINDCLDSIEGLEGKNDCLQRENEILFSDLNDIKEQLQKCVEAKEELEIDLYKRFILVLNEKKAKIRSLQKSLKEVEEMVEKSTQARDNKTMSESTVERNRYEESTDEESENLTQPSISAPVVKPRRDSLLSNADVTDVAPTRKRRQRMQKVAATEPKMALYKAPNTAREKLDSASQKISEKELSTKGTASNTEKNNNDPEDLFDDI